MKNKYDDIFLAHIREVEQCLESECYFAALAVVLTFPDICGNAEYPHKGVGDRYTQWYNTYIGQYEKPTHPYSNDMPYLSGEVVYSLRNAFLHTGNPNIERGKIKDINCKIDHFSLEVGKSVGGDTSCVSYGAEMEIRDRGYIVDVNSFCRKLLHAAEKYYVDNREKFDFFCYSVEEDNEDILV